MRRFVTIYMGLFSVVYLLPSCNSKKYPDPKTVEGEMASFVMEDGFLTKPVAVEPLVIMPVSMTIDEEGRTYVVELRDYPTMQDSSQGTPNGKSTIKELVDRDGDGVFDTAYIFATHITDVTSVLPYKGGLLVAAAPRILYLKDVNGDHKADVADTLFSGFFTGNSEAQITNLTYGIDNWIYANNTGQAGEVYSNKEGRKGQKRMSMAGHDFRFRMDSGVFEAESGTGQFGLAIDDWNHRFYTQNDRPVQTNPIRWRYLHRHDYMPSYQGDYDITDYGSPMFQLSATPYWRQVRTERRQRQYDSLKLGQKEYARDHFTGASGATFYGGDAFPAGYYGSLFVGEVAGNLIHRSVLSYPLNSITMKASRSFGNAGKEFMASTDMWTRPCNFYSGPDGALYFIDIYRQHIETPVAIPDDLKAEMDFAAGNDKGRIYEILPKGRTYQSVRPRLGELASKDLVAYLSHANNWFRSTAQRLLIERQDKSVIPEVHNLLASGPDGRCRLRALYILHGMGALSENDVRAGLADKEPGVRENALMLAESFPGLRADIAGALKDSSAAVAFQAILTVGNMPAGIAIPLLAKSLEIHSNDSLYNVAVLSSLPGSSIGFLKALKTNGSYFARPEKFKLQFVKMAGFVFAARNFPGDHSDILSFFGDGALQGSWRTALLKGFYDGLDSREGNRISAEAKAVLLKWKGEAGEEDKSLIEEILSH